MHLPGENPMVWTARRVRAERRASSIPGVQEVVSTGLVWEGLHHAGGGLGPRAGCRGSGGRGEVVLRGKDRRLLWQFSIQHC